MPQQRHLVGLLAILDQNSMLVAIIEMSQSTPLVAGIVLGQSRTAEEIGAR